MSHTRLYQLQSLDSQIDTTRKRLEEIDQQLSQNEAVHAAQVALTEAQATHHHWRARQTDLELERTQLKEEAEAAEKRLYAGKIQNPRELADLQNKIAELRRRREGLEEPLLEAMYGNEESAEILHQAEVEFERVKAKQTDTLGVLTAEQAELKPKLRELEDQATEVRSNVSTANLTLYDQLRQRPGSIAVTKLNGEECGVCGVQVTSQLIQRIRRGEVIECPTCGRILHSP